MIAEVEALFEGLPIDLVHSGTGPNTDLETTLCLGTGKPGCCNQAGEDDFFHVREFERKDEEVLPKNTPRTC